MSLSGPLIASNKVVIFSWVNCPYCKKAKTLFDSLTKDVSYYYVDKMPDGEKIHQEIINATGYDTVPAVFIKGNLIGGFSDSESLHRQGKLEAMLAE